MLCSLILPAVLLASQAMALNSTYAYVPGFFAQDSPGVDPNAIGAVSACKNASGAEAESLSSPVVAGSIRFARFEPWTLANVQAQDQGSGLEGRIQ